ncbi:transcription termination factor 1 [Indicator indicator]|uniref:transcription termination factor 1 n=1 Tax=Indicator indicator TaxID=1002788 RepID=UPI0023DFC3BB|nr:transcription termination factor 1 [Indicator indicator]
MTGKASAGDFQVQNSLKKKKKRRKHKLMKVHETDEGETVEKAERGCASPLLFEDQTAGSDEGPKKKKKSKKPKQQQQQSLLDNSCGGWDEEIGNKTGRDASQKRKKKQKHDDGAEEQSDVTCVKLNHHNVENCQEVDADYVYVQQPVKKKRKRKLPEEDEVCEEPASEAHDEKDSERLKKKRKKKRCRSTQAAQGDKDVAGAQSLVSPPEQNRQRESTEKGGVAVPQRCHEAGDCDAASEMSERSADVSSKFSKPAEAAAPRPQKAAVRAKVPKSSAFIMQESSSESEEIIRTPEPSASNKKDNNKSFTEMADSDELSVDEEEYLDNSGAPAGDLDVARQELEEFIPHVKTMSEHSIRSMAGRDLARFKEFKKQGVAVKFGRFSQKENSQLQKNIEEFLSLTGIDSAEKLLFSYRYPEDREAIQRLKAEYQFCEKLSEGIPRPWRLIYYRARKMFDPKNYKGKYSNEEKEMLKRYQAMYGNDWKKISAMMSRSNISIARKYSEIKSDINHGAWSKEETQKLINAVEEVIKKRIEKEEATFLSSSVDSSRDLSIEREKLYQNLPWAEIETQVGTRYWKQCKQKWLTILRIRMNKGKRLCRGKEGLQAKINLIKRLYELKVEDANDVNWEEVCNAVGDVPRSYVQAKFYKLKVSCVPFWQRKTFSEIIDYLYEHQLPEFEEELKKKGGKHDSVNSAAARGQKAFRLSDIFDGSEDSDS